jgi:hypothetical protein
MQVLQDLDHSVLRQIERVAVRKEYPTRIRMEFCGHVDLNFYFVPRPFGVLFGAVHVAE